VDGMESKRIHVIRKAAGTTDAGDDHKIFPLDAEFRKTRMHRGENGVIAAAGAPADLLIGLKIFFSSAVAAVLRSTFLLLPDS